jgi:hypothetical protein
VPKKFASVIVPLKPPTALLLFAYNSPASTIVKRSYGQQGSRTGNCLG